MYLVFEKYQKSGSLWYHLLCLLPFVCLRCTSLTMVLLRSIEIFRHISTYHTGKYCSVDHHSEIYKLRQLTMLFCHLIKIVLFSKFGGLIIQRRERNSDILVV